MIHMTQKRGSKIPWTKIPWTEIPLDKDTLDKDTLDNDTLIITILYTHCTHCSETNL